MSAEAPLANWGCGPHQMSLNAWHTCLCRVRGAFTASPPATPIYLACTQVDYHRCSPRATAAFLAHPGLPAALVHAFGASLGYTAGVASHQLSASTAPTFIAAALTKLCDPQLRAAGGREAGLAAALAGSPAALSALAALLRVQPGDGDEDMCAPSGLHAAFC